METQPIITTQNLNLWFGHQHILRNITTQLHPNQVHAIVGPSGSGKTTFLRTINRMHDKETTKEITGEINYRNQPINDKKQNPIELRKKIGMVLQRPCVFPKTILENVLFGIKAHQKLNKKQSQQTAEKWLKAVSLWPEVKHRLDDPASKLSMGQQQRLCVARTLAIEPEILLLDEPTASLDPLSTRAIEDLLMTLKQHYTIILVTHSIPQAKRISDNLLFMCQGEIIEQGRADQLFNTPQNKQTQQYLQEEYCPCP